MLRRRRQPDTTGETPQRYACFGVSSPLKKLVLAWRLLRFWQGSRKSRRTRSWRWDDASQSGKANCGLRRRMCREARGIRSTRSSTGYWLKPSSTSMSNPSAGPSTRRTSAALASRPACTSGCCLWATSRASSSQRGIAWRCADSLSLKSFLGYTLAEATPEHSSLTVIRKRLPVEVHEQVFAFVLKVAQEKKLLKGKTVAVDATLLEANAAMKSIMRRDTGEDWKEYLKRLAEEAGIEDPTDEDLRRFDKKRKGKKVSNKDWVSPSDPDARIMKMKDGRTHLAHKAEHAIDLDSGLLLAATIHHGDRADSESLLESLVAAQANLIWSGSEADIRSVPADKGYHKAETLAWCRGYGIRTYIPERESKTKRRWTDKPAEWQEAYYCQSSPGSWSAQQAVAAVA